mgnify:CR=1 FL=1
MKSEAYTTGAWLSRKRVLQEDGSNQWQWVVDSFDCDCFHNKEQTKLSEFPALNKEDLIIKDEELANE